MKFNEKLTELRKKEGLSQEELGYKLNVTRQTVSKWELGQTTPEMDKLVEMSKIFNISVDELINESQEISNEDTVIIEEQTIEIEEKETKHRNVFYIIVGILIIVLTLIAVIIYSEQKKDKEEKQEAQSNLFSSFFNVFDKIIDKGDDIQENINENMDNSISENTQNSITENIFNSIDNMNKDTKKEMDKAKFNNSIEILNGTKMGGTVTTLLDRIITSNKTQERKITVKYNEIETQNEDELKNIKRKIETFDDYEITFEYDAEGFINKVLIEKL